MPIKSDWTQRNENTKLDCNVGAEKINKRCFIKNVLSKWYQGGESRGVKLLEHTESWKSSQSGRTPRKAILWEPLLIWLIRISNYKSRISLGRIWICGDGEHFSVKSEKEERLFWRAERSESERRNFRRNFRNDRTITDDTQKRWPQRRTCEIGHLNSRAALKRPSLRLKLEGEKANVWHMESKESRLSTCTVQPEPFR